jgi:hypothetical protein
VPPARADAVAIARKIAAKLYGDGTSPGLITARGESIRGKVPSMRTASDSRRAWSPSPNEIAAYLAYGDPVSLIRAKRRDLLTRWHACYMS